MEKHTKQLLILLGLLAPALVLAKPKLYPSVGSEFYGKGLCETNDKYKCVKVARGQTWNKMFPNEEQRDIVQLLNRSDTYLYAGRIIAVPKSFEGVTTLSIAPFSHHIKPSDTTTIIVNQNLLAWGAYDKAGNLVNWGPISSGKDYCPDIHRACKTQTGIYYTFNRKGKGCRSNTFPVGRGGSNMPYCMFVYKGYALHGSNEVFGYRASHGCMRLITRHAKWLNENFVEIPSDKNSLLGTRVIIQEVIYKDTPPTQVASAAAVTQQPQAEVRRAKVRSKPRYYRRARRSYYGRSL